MSITRTIFSTQRTGWLAVGLALLVAACDGAGPGDSSPEGQIGYVSAYAKPSARRPAGDSSPEGQIGYVGPDQALYVIGVESGEIEKLADEVGGQIRWSPDGSRVAYVGLYGYLEAHQVYVMNADGTDRRVVSLWEQEGKLEPHLDGGVHPVWSPDGTRIAFSRCTDCEIGGNDFEIFIVDLDMTDGLNEVQLTDNLFADHLLDWSPDGEKILFQSDLAPDSTWDRYGDAYTMNLNGSGKRTVLISDSTFGRGWGEIRYSPDGKRLAFTAGSTSTEIYLANADGSDIQQITDNSLTETFFSWSPDGTWITFWADRERYGVGHIYVINIDGTGQRKLTSGAAVYGPPEWRPRPR